MTVKFVQVYSHSWTLPWGWCRRLHSWWRHTCYWSNSKTWVGGRKWSSDEDGLGWWKLCDSKQGFCNNQATKWKARKNLWFALRGAGTSFGIMTEFLYTVYKRQETFTLLIPVDFRNIENAAANTKKYLFMCYSTRQYFDGVFPYIYNLLPYNLPYVRTKLSKLFG